MRSRVALYVALLLAGIATGMTIRYASFAPWGTDSGSYVHAARRWADRDLFSPDAFQLWPRWNQLGVPLGHTRAAIAGTYTTMYPLGFPVLLAAADIVHRQLGVYVVAPIFAGVLVLCTFLVARQVTMAAGALVAATLVALSPVVLIHSVTPMSDVPATAFVILSLVMSMRQSPLAAVAGGLAFAMATMMRPILAPLGVVPFVLILVRNWKHAVLFACAAAVGPALLAWSQLVLYGSALKSGYPGFEGFFNRDRIAVNAEVYVRNLSSLHSPFLFLGLAAAVPLYFTRATRDRDALKLIAALLAIAVINYALYLPYMTYDDVWSTRFLLPAQVALFILLAAVVVDAVVAVSRLARVMAIVCVVPIGIVLYEGTKVYPYIVGAWTGQAHTRLMLDYLAETLPRNAVVISFLHSGGIAFKTGAQIARFDLMSPADSELFIETLVRRRYEPVLVIDGANEWGTYVIALRGTKYERLDWPERATAIGFTQMWYMAVRDRERPREQMAPTDVLQIQK